MTDEALILLEAEDDVDELKRLFYKNNTPPQYYDGQKAMIDKVDNAAAFAIRAGTMVLANRLIGLLAKAEIESAMPAAYVQALEANEMELAAKLRPRTKCEAEIILWLTRTERVFDMVCREYGITAHDVLKTNTIYALVNRNAVGAMKAIVRYAYIGNTEVGHRLIERARTTMMKKTLEKLFDIKADQPGSEEDDVSEGDD